METVAERKSRYVSDILKAHPIYLEEAFISQQTGKRLQKLPEQAIFWLWHLAKGTKATASQLLMQVEGYSDLWICHEEVRDGEYEYGSEFFVRASSCEEAEKKAWHYIKDNYFWHDEGEEEKPASAYMNESGWMEEPSGYRLFRVSSIRKVSNLQDILNVLGCVTFDLKDTPEEPVKTE